MSVEITLNLTDYKKILGWFELAFAKKNEIQLEDNQTFRKVSVMAQMVLEEQEAEKDEDRKHH